jgi:hypothetical protein
MIRVAGSFLFMIFQAFPFFQPLNPRQMRPGCSCQFGVRGIGVRGSIKRWVERTLRVGSSGIFST